MSVTAEEAGFKKPEDLRRSSAILGPSAQGSDPCTSRAPMSTSLSVLRAGDTLGAYQLLLPIGQGGMGRVWVAREKEVGAFARYVAIKTALAESSPNRKFWTALVDEAHIASSLRHPNVCVIHAVETEGSVVYLVMDWSDAGSLREVLDAAPGEKISPQLAARIVAAVCAGLHAAHELTGEDGTTLGVVHRDVSPQNILFSTSGQVKLADFGVAKARGQLQEATRTGELKGKLSYMAPEQVTLKPFDRRADIFALGCVLYEATVGKRPFHGNDALATLYSLLEQPLTKPTELDPSYPAGLEQILLKALAREPENRYQTAEELGYALESWMATTRAIVTESNIAGLLRDTLGERMKERSQALRTIVRKLDAGESLGPDRPVDELHAPTELGMSASAVPTAAQGSVKRFAPLVVLGLGLAAGAVLWLKSEQGPDHKATTPDATTSVVRAAVTSAAPIAPPTQEASASERAPTAPSVDSTQATSAAPTPKSGARGRASSHAAARTAAATTPDAATPAAPPVRAPGELPAVVEKAPRSLDADNPFAKKP